MASSSLDSQVAKLANLKVKEIYKIGGIGIVLTVETISNGTVKPGYSYKLNGDAQKIIVIKDFEHNFCPTEFIHPADDIHMGVKMGNCKKEDIVKDMILLACLHSG